MMLIYRWWLGVGNPKVQLTFCNIDDQGSSPRYCGQSAISFGTNIIHKTQISAKHEYIELCSEWIQVFEYIKRFVVGPGRLYSL